MKITQKQERLIYAETGRAKAVQPVNKTLIVMVFFSFLLCFFLQTSIPASGAIIDHSVSTGLKFTSSSGGGITIIDEDSGVDAANSEISYEPWGVNICSFPINSLAFLPRMPIYTM